MSGTTVNVQLGAGTDVQLTARTHGWRGDEPTDKGGGDAGATPYEQLVGALGTCTALTLRMYSNHKGIPLESVTIDASFTREKASDCPECEEDGDVQLDVIRSHIVLKGDFTEAQRERLTQIASRCPVHKTLQGGPKMFETVEFA